MKNFVQVGDRFFRVDLSGDKATLNECKPEEVVAWEVERLCLTDDDPGLDASVFQEIIDKTDTDMRKGLEESLKNLIVKSMGMERNSEDKFWISGSDKSESPVAQILKTKLEARLKEVDLHRDLDLTDLEKKNLRAAMKKSFKEKYEREVSSMVYREAQNLAAQHVREVVKELADEKLKVVARQMVERAIRHKRGY